MVLKPAPTTPLTTLKLGELARGVLPDGVLNVIAGGKQSGLGREGGVEGLIPFLESKTMLLDDEPAHRAAG